MEDDVNSKEAINMIKVIDDALAVSYDELTELNERIRRLLSHKEKVLKIIVSSKDISDVT